MSSNSKNVKSFSEPSSSRPNDIPLLGHFAWHLPDPMIVIDQGGFIITANSCAGEFLDVEISSVHGRSIDQFFKKNDSLPLLPAILSAVKQDGIIAAQRIRSSAPFQPVTIETKVGPEFNGSATIVCFISISRRVSASRHHKITSEIAKELFSVKPLKEVYHEVVRVLVEIAEIDHVTLTTLVPSGTHFVVQAEFPKLLPEIIDQAIPVKGKPQQEGLIRDKKSLIVLDTSVHGIATESEEVSSLTRQLNVKSLVIVPMINKDRVIGTIGIDSFSVNTQFLSADIEFYETIASQVAMAIENARLFEAEETLRRIYREAEAGKSLQETASIWFDRLAEITPFETASLQLIISSRRMLVHARGFDPAKACPDLLPSLDHDPLVREILDSGQIRVIPHTRDAALWKGQSPAHAVKSWIGIPLSCGDGIRGLITLDHSEAGFFGNVSSDRLEELNRLSFVAAADVRNAYLYHASGRHIGAFSLVSSIAELVGSKIDVEELLWQVTREIARGLGCDFCCFYLQERNGATDCFTPRAFWPKSLEEKPDCIFLPIGMSLDADPVLSFFSTHSKSQADIAIPPNVISLFRRTLRSIMIEPIETSSIRRGFVIIGDAAEGKFRESDRLLLRTLVNLTAKALDRESGLEKLQAISNCIVQSEDIRDLLIPIIETAKDFAHKDKGVIFLLDGLTILNRIEKSISNVPDPVLTGDDKVVARLLNLRQDRILDIPNTSYEPGFINNHEYTNMSFVGIRLTINGRVIGLLYLIGPSHQPLQSSERSFLATLAEFAAVAIERLRLNTELRNAGAMFHSLVDNVPVSVYRKNANSQFLLANDAFCASVNKPLNEIAGKTDYDFYPKEIADKYIEDDRLVIANGPLSMDEEHVDPSTNKRIFVRVHKTRVLNAKKEIVGTQGIFWDVTEEKRTAEQYKALVEESPNAILIVAAGRVSLANDAASRLFGYDSQEALKDVHLGEILCENPGNGETLLEALRRSGTVEATIHPRNASRDITVVVHTRPILGLPESEQVVFQDITSQHKLLRYNHHLVKNDLLRVSSLMKLQIRRNTNSKVRGVLTEAIQRINLMVSIHAQIMKGTDNSAFSIVELSDLLNQHLTTVAKAHGSRMISLNLKLQPVRLGLDTAIICAMLVHELVTNAFKHAFKANGGTVSVKLYREDDQVNVCVTDDGCGISGTRPGSLGLQLVHDYVTRLNGQLSFPSSPRGTQVSIIFPN